MIEGASASQQSFVLCVVVGVSPLGVFNAHARMRTHTSILHTHIRPHSHMFCLTSHKFITQTPP